MSTLEAGLAHVVDGLRAAGGAVVDAVRGAWHHLVAWWSDTWDRHRQLMDDDPRYPVALVTGGAAAVRVLIANPMVANAIGVLLSDLLGVSDRSRPTRPGSERGWRDDEPWQPRPVSRPLWSTDWDDLD